MKKWNNYPVFECDCGYETLDELAFVQHLQRKNHKAAGFETERKAVAEPMPPVATAASPVSSAAVTPKRRMKQNEKEMAVEETTTNQTESEKEI